MSPLSRTPVDALGDDAQRVDVEAGVGLVEDGDLRLEQLELQDLVALLLAAGEALVDVALGEGRVHLQPRHRLLLLLDPQAQLGGLAADGGGRGAQEVRDRDAGDLDGVLHRQEDAGAGALVDGHREDVLAVEGHGAAGDGVLRVAGDGVGQRRLAGAVRAHDRVGLAGADRQVDAGEDLLAVGAVGLDGDGAGRGSRAWLMRSGLHLHEDVVALDGHGEGGHGARRGQAGGLAGAQVEQRAVQPALDVAVLDVALGQRDVGVGADVGDREDLAAGAGDADGTAVQLDADRALLGQVGQRAGADEPLGSARSCERPLELGLDRRSSGAPRAPGTPMSSTTSAKKPRTTMRRATSAGMPRDCR